MFLVHLGPGRFGGLGVRLSMTEQDKAVYEALSYYTLAHGDPAFIHQHVVDAFAAQHATEHSKPITVAFALVGLYLYIEKGFSGREVQQAHMRLAKRRREWPKFSFPADRGAVSVHDVMRAEPGRERDHVIEAWCASVWSTYSRARDQIAALVRSELDR
jgi:hypothetical protein